VLYDIRGWTTKDQDKLSVLSRRVLESSTLPGGFMSETFSEEPATTSVCQAFASKLDALAEKLGHTQCNFVRCIKASNPLAAGTFTAGLVLNQLRYTGMLDTLSIRRLGFPSRLPHLDFWQAYHVLDTESKISNFDDENAITAACEQLCESIKKQAPAIAATLQDKPIQEQIDDCIRVGKSTNRAQGNMDFVSNVLIRDWLSRELDKQKNEILSKSAVLVQAAYRGVALKQQYAAETAAALKIGPMIRGVHHRLEYYQLKWGRVESWSRSDLVVGLRAAAARREYYAKRAILMLDDLMHIAQNSINATVMRQMYYEKKVELGAKEQEQKEARRMRMYETFSKDYMDKWLEELLREGALLESKKEAEMTEAEQALSKARQALREFRVGESKREEEGKAKMAKFAEIEDAAYERIQFHLDMNMPTELKELYQKAEGCDTRRRPPSPQRRPVLVTATLPKSPR
jgi:hypothetical protein